MKRYNKITCFENKKRYELLKSFRMKLLQYFENIEYINNGQVLDNKETLALRSEINKSLANVQESLSIVEIIPSILIKPKGVSGFPSNQIDVTNNIFSLGQFEIPPAVLYDFLDKAIGIFEHDRNKSILRTFSPFYWFIRLFNFIVDIPFRILGELGLNRSKIENSFGGKLIRGLLAFLTGVAAFLTILHYLGLL